jgi:hypothetical protein
MYPTDLGMFDAAGMAKGTFEAAGAKRSGSAS